jgi:protoporphyrinogen oxidase
MKKTIIIGAGPAGLTTAFELQRLGLPAHVVERDDLVGGISRTVEYNGYRFDIGGHRFFTKVPMIQRVWEDLLGDDFLERPRLSRIYYNDRFFDYPLRPINALRGLGPWEAFRVGISYLRSRLMPHREETNFEQWVSNRFGTRLFEIFFKTYTEKVWGMPCSEISADWAAQRIKNLDLIKAVRNALVGSAADQETITTLIDRFHYPRLGPGMMWDRCRESLEANGVPVETGKTVERIHHNGRRVEALQVRDCDDETSTIETDSVVSSMALRELLLSLEPAPPDSVIAAAEKLRYRDFLTVVLIVERSDLFPDNWIYIHSPEVRVGRVQNFKAWSPEMVPDPAMTSLGLEYFVDIGDDLWSADDSDLIDLATREMSILGLISETEVVDGTVVRMPKAYPVYDSDYRTSVQVVREYLKNLDNLQVIGRNGQHRYNNQDHSMLAGIFAARNISGEELDVWSINVEQEYHEAGERESTAVTDRLVPEPLPRPELETLLRQAFAHYDPIALGVAVGTVSGLGLLVATALLLFGAGSFPGPTLSLLGNYLIGYNISWPGAILGTLEAATGGFAVGFVIAKLTNFLIGAYEASIRRKLEFMGTLDPLET